jgi:hypothetical protein
MNATSRNVLAKITSPRSLLETLPEMFRAIPHFAARANLSYAQS